MKRIALDILVETKTNLCLKKKRKFFNDFLNNFQNRLRLIRIYNFSNRDTFLGNIFVFSIHIFRFEQKNWFKIGR